MDNNESNTDLSWVTFTESPYEIQCETKWPMKCTLQATTRYSVTVACGCFEEMTYGYHCQFCSERIDSTMNELGTATLNCSKCRCPSMEIVDSKPIAAL